MKRVLQLQEMAEMREDAAVGADTNDFDSTSSNSGCTCSTASTSMCTKSHFY